MLNKFMPSDMLSILSNTYANQGKYLKSEVEYMNFFFDKTMSINVGFMSQLSDQELLEAFQKSPDFKLAVLVKDSHSSNGVRVEQIKPNNLHSIATARRLDAVVLSNQTFSKAFETINEGKFDSTALNLWHKITYLYKAGFLLNPGVILRNMIDSTLKNYVTSADPIGMTQSYAKALSMYPKYVATIRDMLHKAPEGRLTSEWTEEYFKSNFARMTKQEYLLIHGFIEDGPSAGLTKELQDYYSKNLQKGAWSSVTHLLSLMMEPNKQVEQISRLAEYFWAIEKNGMSNTAAYELISKTHFDYALKTNVDKLIELVFPFYTFTLNNYSFWIDMITSKPWLMSVFRDVMTPSWNFDELDFHDLNHNRSMQYQILAGNMKISDSGMTLKLNPSFMDVFNIMTDPVNALKSKLNTPLRAGVDTLTGVASGEGFGTVITDTTNALSLIPLAGGIGNQIPLISPQGQKYYERTGNILNAILPSIFGATAQYPNKVKQQYTKKTWVKKPGKPHKTYFKAKHFDKYYPKYPKRVSRGSFYAENFYSKLYTKKGVSRMKLRSIPVTPMTVKYRMKDYWYFFK
jgi:hypothetical protein